MFPQTPFKFQVSTNLHFGAGESEKLGKILNGLGYRKVAAIVDQGVFSHPQIRKALKSVKKSQISLSVYKNEAVEPTYDYLESFKKKLIAKGYEALIGIGGGSAMDLTKGVATLLTNKGPALSYRGFPKLKNKPLPVIAIPTTAGTGSEVTYNAVFTDAKEKKKLGINSVLNFPICAIVDPKITVNCPKSVTVSSGCDALVHTLESFVHKNHTPISRMYSKEAFRLLFNSLMRVLDEPDNVDIRANLALGAYLAAIALMNAGSGVAGAFSYSLGAVYKVPHGYAGAVFLPFITKINAEKDYFDYAELYDLIEKADRTLSIREKSLEFAKKIQTLMDKLDVPRHLSEFGLEKKDIEFMIAQYDILKVAIDQNPIEFTKADAKKMISSLS